MTAALPLPLHCFLRKPCLRTLAAVLLLAALHGLISPQCMAQREETEIDGLVIDQTRTKIGYEFYQQFVLLWEAPEQKEASGYTIAIIERASPQWGSWVWVQVNDMTVYQAILKPQQEQIEEETLRAVKTVRKYLLTTYLDEKDITGGDLFGNGI